MSPTLWKRLRLVLGRSGGLPPVEMVTAWLERSCSLPLEIEIIEDILSPNRAPIRDTRFLDCLIPFCERWSYLKLRLDFSVLKSLLERDDLNLPKLEVLHVGAGCITEFHCIHSFRNASRLRQLWISSWGRQPSLWHEDYVSSFAVSFSDITTLDIHMGKNGTSGSPYIYFHILSACTKLEKCSFGVDDFDDNPLSPFHFTAVDCITLTSLKDLGITFSGRFGSPQILDAFAFPRLQRLELIFEDYSRPSLDGTRVPTLDILLRLQARSRFSLVTLEFLNMNDTIDTDGILEFFKAVPSLERVELMNCILDAHKISKALVVDTELKTSLLPKLSYISIYTFSEQDSIIDNGPQNDDCIADMVESRLVALSAKTDSYSASGPLVFEVDFEIFHRHLRRDVLNRLQALEEWNTAKLRIITSAGDDN
ncbi:hypothetical protein VKT23_017459 [Stygiomarasmius scandens]|uniref:Uncharacterized protein n=1 Tax=Marasmiellus scandens TaxID=2682957 RepID=A0ABR1IUT7_9AGAR